MRFLVAFGLILPVASAFSPTPTLPAFAPATSWVGAHASRQGRVPLPSNMPRGTAMPPAATTTMTSSSSTVGFSFGPLQVGIGSGVIEHPMLEFVGEKRAASIGKFEKFDDQIMGGMSQSAILSYGEGEEGYAAFTGVVRVEGGGFCGSRMKLLDQPLDLSGYAGLYIKAQGDGKTYKLNCRTTPTAGEAVYQAEFTPPEGPEWSTVRIPWTAFRLVKRAVPVEGAPPLPAATVYQLGFVLSKFSFGEDDFNDKFSAGSFRLKMRELGVYEDQGIKEAWVDGRESNRGESVEVKEESIIQDSMRFKPDGKKRSWWSRMLLGRVRGLLRKRVSKRRSQMAEELLAMRKEGKKLSEIRRSSWQAPSK